MNENATITTIWKGYAPNVLPTVLYATCKDSVLAYMRNFCEEGDYAETVIAEGEKFSAILTYASGKECFVYEVKQ